MTAYLQAGYRPVTMGRLVSALSQRASRRRTAWCSTFDDGLASQITNGVPVLLRFAVPATFFVMPGGFQDGVHRYMNGDDFRTLRDAGFELGAHTLNHANLPNLLKFNPGAFQAEVVELENDARAGAGPAGRPLRLSQRRLRCPDRPGDSQGRLRSPPPGPGPAAWQRPEELYMLHRVGANSWDTPATVLQRLRRVASLARSQIPRSGPGPALYLKRARWLSSRTMSSRALTRGSGSATSMSGSHVHAGVAHGPVAAPSAAARFAPRLLAVLLLTTLYLLAEVVGGLLTGSLALLADAGHMLTDVLGLGMALLAIRFAQRTGHAGQDLRLLPSRDPGRRGEQHRPVRHRRLTFSSKPGTASPSRRRSRACRCCRSRSAAWWSTWSGCGCCTVATEESLNVRAARLEVLSDLLGSVGVVLAALVIQFTGWWPARPAGFGGDWCIHPAAHLAPAAERAGRPARIHAGPHRRDRARVGHARGARGRLGPRSARLGNHQRLRGR